MTNSAWQTTYKPSVDEFVRTKWRKAVRRRIIRKERVPSDWKMRKKEGEKKMECHVEGKWRQRREPQKKVAVVKTNQLKG